MNPVDELLKTIHEWRNLERLEASIAMISGNPMNARDSNMILHRIRIIADYIGGRSVAQNESELYAILEKHDARF